VRLVLLFVMASAGSAVQADEEEVVASAIRPAHGIEWCAMTVKVVDAQGVPIEGATVRPWALRAGNAHGGWDGQIGAPRETLTDPSGQTSVVYPKAMTWGTSESNPVISVSVILKHPEFVARNVHVDIPVGETPAVPELMLKPGIRLRIAGVEPGTDKPLDNCYLFIENQDVGAQEFAREADGWLRSNPISEDRRWFRVVHAEPGKSPRFSQSVAWTPDDPASRERRVEVRAGTRVQGKISDNVARPIERGHVVAWCGSPIRKDDENLSRSRPILWLETALIERDGSFVFESLPSGYLAQFYALANDSISAQPTDAAFELCCKWFAVKQQMQEFFRNGQMMRLAGSQSELTIEMESAGEVRVTCLDPDGKPLRGITVMSWPNQFVVGAGSTVFCDRRSSLSGLQATSQNSPWWKTSHYAVETSADGVSVIRNLPAGNQSFIASNELWASDVTNTKSIPGSPAELVIKLHRRP
jgi:hypothetical protein